MNASERSWVALIERGAQLGPDPALADVADAELEDLVRTGAAEIAALTCRWLGLLGEFVIRGGWDGFRSPGEWLAYTVGLGNSTAREHVRVALRLRELPKIRARFAAGTLSYSKVRALTRCAVPELEDLLLDWADDATAAQLERIIATWRTTTRTGPDAEVADRRLESRWLDPDTMEIRLRLPADDAAAFLDAIDRHLFVIHAAANDLAAAAVETTDPAAASAEAARTRIIDDLGRTLDPDDLLPHLMIDHRYDLNLAVAGLQDELARVAVAA